MSVDSFVERHSDLNQAIDELIAAKVCIGDLAGLINSTIKAFSEQRLYDNEFARIIFFLRCNPTASHESVDRLYNSLDSLADSLVDREIAQIETDLLAKHFNGAMGELKAATNLTVPIKSGADTNTIKEAVEKALSDQNFHTIAEKFRNEARGFDRVSSVSTIACQYVTPGYTL